MAATDTHTTTEDLLEVVFSVRSMLRLYNAGQLTLERVLKNIRGLNLAVVKLMTVQVTKLSL
jgi:hypothetical protein